MINFNSEAILKRIIEEIPILSNRRGVIRVKERKSIVNRVVYAYYCNMGVPDPDFTYDRTRNPIKTTQDTTLCEIYSWWEEDLDTKELKQRLIKEGEMFENSEVYKGPWIGNWFHPAKDARMGMPYDFSHSAYGFKEHFNKLCDEIGFKINLVYTDDGNYFIESERLMTLLGMNLHVKDPTLREVFSKVDEAVERIRNSNLENAVRII